ncbi:MAG: hypothetical protein V2A56_12915 [bacterium]
MKSTHVVLRIPGFYASLEKEFHPAIATRPVVVCAGIGLRAVVLSGCPLALRAGVRPGMRLADIQIPDLEIIPASAGKYTDGTNRVLRALSEELPEVRVLRPGIFAALWEGGVHYLPHALKAARLRVATSGFTGSWGVASELACAEIAALYAREGETRTVPPGEEREFLDPLPLTLLPDLGPRHRSTLQEMGVHTFGDLARLPKTALHRLFGPEGPLVREIALSGHRPSLRRQWRGLRRLGEDAEDPAVLHAAVADLTADGVGEIYASGHRPGTLLLTLIYADRRRTTGSIRPEGLQHEGHWQAVAHRLASELWKRRVRIGEVRMTILYGRPETHQLALFVPEYQQERDHLLTVAVRRIRQRLGGMAVRFASSMQPREHPIPSESET